MSSHFDASEFIDDDLTPAPKPGYGAAPTTPAPLGVGERRAPSREEVESKVSEMHQRLAELKTEQHRLERERSALEETRRRQSEFSTGRQEMIHHLTRAISQMEEAELTHRREVEQRSKSLIDMREALTKVVSLNQEGWNKENFEMELTRALTTVDNARMEWNSARVKFTELTGNAPAADSSMPPSGALTPNGLPTDYAQLCKLGLAINWPLVLVGLGIFLMLWLRR